LAGAFAAVDKLGRESEERTRARLAEAGLDGAGVDRAFGLFAVRDLDALERAYGAVPGLAEEAARLRTYERHLADLGLDGYIAFDPTIVRGLAYYTGTVFEIFDRQGELRAICGGGRYDDLLAAVGGAALPAVGFGMGDVVIAELLRARGLLPAYAPAVDYFIAAWTEAEEPLQRRIAARLRAGGASVLYGLKRAGLSRQLKDADARGARRVIILGPDEVAAGVARIREMGTGEERSIALDELIGGAGVGVAR
jgi:histidyl-tRNA synthetase